MSSVVEKVDTSAMPAGVGVSRPIQLPATRYRQGGRVMYHTILTLGGLTQFIVNRPDPNRLIEGNRRVDAGRAKKFGQYLIDNDNWVSPAIIVRVPSGEIQFSPTPGAEFDDGTAWGLLSIPVQVLTEIVNLDGQHRTLGDFMAFDMINERISKLRDTVEKAERNGDRQVATEVKARLKKALAVRERLGDEHISVDIAAVGTAEAKLIFADINNNAKGVNPDYTTYLDQRQVVNRITVALIEEHPLLQDRVELGQSGRMSAGNPKFLGAKAIADIVRAVHVGGTGRIGSRIEDEMSRNEAAATRKVASFLDLLVGSFPDLRAVMDGTLEPAELRRTSMLGSATMLRVLAALYRQLTKDGGQPGDPAPMSRLEIQEFFKKLAPHLKDIPIAEADPLWMPTGAFLPGNNAPQARPGSIKQLIDAMVDWARNGNPAL